MLAIHGGVQNKANFTAIAQRLAPLGVLTYSIDLRGHGDWLSHSKKRTKLDYEGSTGDVVRLTEQLRAEHPGLPVFCIGESLGASTALHAVKIKPKLFDGMILASPGTRPAAIHLKSIIVSIWQAVRTLGTSIDLRPYVQHISEDRRSSAEMIDDPHTRITASVCDLYHMATFVRKNTALAPKVDPSIPILVMLGAEDGICSPQSAVRLFAALPTKDKSIAKISGCGHLLVTTEYLKPNVVDTVAQWLKTHCQPPDSMAVNCTTESSVGSADTEVVH